MTPLAWAVVLFAAGLVVSTLIVALVLIHLPADHLVRTTSRPRHLVLKILKNLLGVALVAVGIVLSVPGVPGQGLLTVFAGILLLDLPGKRRLERAVLQRTSIRKAVDRLRARFKKPPLEC